MILGIALLLASSSSNVSLDEPGAVLTDVLSELASQSGTAISATGDLGGEVVAVRVRDRPLEATLARLTEALEARLVRDRAGYRIEPDAERTRLREDEGRRRFYVRLRKRLDELAKVTGANEPLDREGALHLVRDRRAAADEVAGTGDEVRWQRRLETEYRRPTGRAIVRSLSTADLSGIADLRPGDSILYSTRPSPYCRLIGVGGKDLRDLFAEEWNLVADASEGSSNPFDWVGDSLWPIDARLSGNVEELRVVVTRPNVHSVVASLWIRVQGDGLGPAGKLQLDVPSDPPKDAPPDEWRVGEAPEALGREVRTARALLNPRDAPDERPKLVEWMSQQPAPEPWRLLSGPLARHARSKELEFVAVLDDGAFGAVRRALANGSAEAYVQELFARHAFERTATGWFIVPRDRWEARRSRLPRREFATFVRALREKGFASVWDRASLYGVPEGVGLEAIPSVFERFLGTSISGTHPAAALGRLLGSLPSAMRGALMNGESIEIALGTSPIRDRLAAAVLDGLLCRPSDEPGAERAYRVNPREDDPVVGLERASKVLTLRLVRDAAFDWVRVRGLGPRFGEPFAARAARSDAFNPPPSDSEPAPRFFPVHGCRAFLEVWVGDRCTYGPVLLVEGDLRGPGVPYGELPEDFRTAYETALEQARRRGGT